MNELDEPIAETCKLIVSLLEATLAFRKKLENQNPLMDDIDESLHELDKTLVEIYMQISLRCGDVEMIAANHCAKNPGDIVVVSQKVDALHRSISSALKYSRIIFLPNNSKAAMDWMERFFGSTKVDKGNSEAN